MEIPKNIIIIGESHATFNFANMDNVNIKSIGSYTMHRVGRDQLEFKDLTNPGCIAVFCFGEIDVRMHIYKQVQLGRNEDEIIDTLTINYIKTIVKQKENGVIPVIMSITPPNSTEPNPMAVGENKHRSRYCYKMNESLRKLCAENSIDFLDVYDKYKDENGLLRTELSDGNYHIKQNSMVIEAFNNLLEEMRKR